MQHTDGWDLTYPATRSEASEGTDMIRKEHFLTREGADSRREQVIRLKGPAWTATTRTPR
jgi:hypothetical protein